MTPDDIIRMAGEAGFPTTKHLSGRHDIAGQSVARFERFAALVAAAERKAIEPIVFGLCISDNNAQEIVNAIRKRGHL